MALTSHKRTKNNFYIILFITIFSYKFIVSEILPISCEGEILNYTISINLTKYLNSLTENKSIIENKTIFEKQEDFEGKKGGIVKGTIYEYITKKKGRLNQFTVYNTYDEALEALNNHSIDYFVCYKEIVGELIQMYTDNLTYINIEDEYNKKDYESGFLMKSDKNKIKKELELLKGSNTNRLYNLMSNWLGVDEGLKYIDKNMDKPDNDLKILLNFNQPPFAYKENDEQKGLIVQLLYDYAKIFNYSLDIKETNTVEDLIPAVMNDTVDVSVGYYYKEDINNNSIYFLKTSINATTVSIIRYDDSINSTEWRIPNSLKDLDGENLAVLSGQEDLIKELFPKSKDKIRAYKSPNELFNLLLKKDVDGILIDKIIVDYYEKNNDRITTYEDILTNNSYGFSFSDKNLSEEFNSFLKDKNYNENKLNELFNEWKEANKNKTIDKEYTVPNENATSKLYVSFTNIRPMCYMENGVYKGYEFDLLFRFAKEKGYEIIINSENINNVSIGCQNITNKEGIYFSEPILKSSSVLAVRKDSKRDILPLTALYGNFTGKNNNIIEIPVEIPDGNIKISSCILPEKFYNDTILLNCSINNITEIEQSYFNGTEIKYGKTNDRIKILHSTLDVNNILNANNLFLNENILKQSNTSNLLCTIFGNKNITNNTNSTNWDDPSNKKTVFNRFIPKKKSSNKVSTILAIVIPCVVALIAIIAVTSLVNRGAASAPFEIKGFKPSETAMGMKSGIP